MKNKKSNTALKMRKRRRLGAFIFVVVLLALAVVAVRIYNMNKPSRDAELLTLVNPWNTIPDGYEPQLCTLSDGQQIDRRCYDDLMRMLDDCRAAGNSPYICSAYRTWDKQQALFDNKIQRLEMRAWTPIPRGSRRRRSSPCRGRASTSLALRSI